jgi:hypothetical protein
VRKFLVENFGFDDSHLKTLGMGKQTGANPDDDWGSIQILIFPTGTEIPADKPAPAASATSTESRPPAGVTVTPTQKP